MYLRVCLHVVVCDFLSCSLLSDSLTNCGSSGCVDFLTPQATVFFLIDFSSQTPHKIGRVVISGEDYITNLDMNLMC